MLKMIKHINFHICILLVLGGMLTACEKETSVEKPNVILILTDDQGYGDIHMHGNDSISTPNMDLLGTEGVRLDRFYVSPVCAPTRASLLTGRYHLRTGTHWVTRGGENMHEEEVTLAELFKANGYATGIFGKWHNGSHYPEHPLGQGFDEFTGFCAGHWNNYFDTQLEHNGEMLPTDGYITDVLTDHALAFMDAHADEPFFCYLPYNAPHSPFQVPDKYFNKYKEMGLTDKNASVYGMVENIDDNISRILSRLEEAGKAEETLIIFITDNGPNGNRFNGGMLGRKGSVHEGGVRVPSFWYWPGKLAGGRVVEEITSHIDVFPTLVSLLGLDAVETLPQDGIDISSLLTGKKEEIAERSIFSHQFSRGGVQNYPGSFRTGQYRFVAYSEAKPELYDMEVDPGQSRNLADSLPELAGSFHEEYQAWIKEMRKDGFTIRPTQVGHEKASRVVLPAHEAELKGSITYQANQNGWANDWLVNWTSPKDTVSWDIEVVKEGTYTFSISHCLKEEDIGTEVVLTIGAKQLENVLKEAFYPEPYPSPDKVDREQEAYEKDWVSLNLGELTLEKGIYKLQLSAKNIRSEACELKDLTINR